MLLWVIKRSVCDHSSPICPHNFSFHTLSLYILCDMSYNSSLICGNKMPSRYNRGFYCRFYCLLNMFRAPLCTSSAAPASILQTGHITLSSAPDQQFQNHSTKYHKQQTLYNTLELLMMGIVVPETCWVSNKICNKKPLLHLVGILFPHINEDARSKSHQI